MAPDRVRLKGGGFLKDGRIFGTKESDSGGLDVANALGWTPELWISRGSYW